MKYGIKCHSTMTDITFYIIENTIQECYKALDNFKNYVHNEPNTWEIYIESFPVYCSEDTRYSFSVGKTESGSYVLVTDLGCGINEEDKAIEFELVEEFIERF